MKTFTVALVLFLSAALTTRGAKYYFSSTAGDDSRTAAQAQSPSTPWKSLTKLNALFPSLRPGDTVFLQRGSIFPGALRVNTSGAAGNPVVITSYGSGAAPIITGFTNLTNWTSAGTNLWASSCPAGTGVNMVKIGNTVQPMGRYPNSNTANGGYAIIDSHSDTTKISSSTLGTGANWTGAELVIRKNRHVLERDYIAAHSGTTIRYYSTSTVMATDKYGFFIQNSLYTLDQNGEWFYDKKAKKMYLYSTTSPSGVAASTVDTLVFIYKRQYLLFNNISFQGSSMRNIFVMQSNYINFSNCSILYSGMDAFKSIQSGYIYLQGTTVDYSLNNGIDINGSNNKVTDCNISHSGNIPGMGNAIQSYLGITVRGDNNIIQYNNVSMTGYCGIEFVGASNTFKNNLVDNFGSVKDDAGGIYTWSGDISSSTRRVAGWIQNNIVLNGITAPDGTDRAVAGIAHGIYLDVNTNTGNVSGNTVANCTAGLFMQDNHELTVQNNTFFHNAAQICLRHALSTMVFKNNDVAGNTAVSLNDKEQNVQASSIDYVNGAPPLSSFAYLHANKYARISSASPFFLLGFKGLATTGSSGLWKSTYAQDWNSTELPLSFAPYTINKLIGSNLYTKGTAIVSPFSLATTGSRVIATIPIGAITGGKAYVTHFTLHSPDAAHTLSVFMQQNISPYTHLTPVINVTSGTPYTNNTVVFDSTYASDGNAALVFMMYNVVPGIYLDNIDIYLAEVTPNDPNTNYLFKYNASKSTLTFSVSGTYQDAAGQIYTGNITLQPYSSIVLFKK